MILHHYVSLTSYCNKTFHSVTVYSFSLVEMEILDFQI